MSENASPLLCAVCARPILTLNLWQRSAAGKGKGVLCSESCRNARKRQSWAASEARRQQLLKAERAASQFRYTAPRPAPPDPEGRYLASWDDLVAGVGNPIDDTPCACASCQEQATTRRCTCSGETGRCAACAAWHAQQQTGTPAPPQLVAVPTPEAAVQLRAQRKTLTRHLKRLSPNTRAWRQAQTKLDQIKRQLAGKVQRYPTAKQAVPHKETHP